MAFLALKTLHIFSATLLFGTGLGSAFHMWATHLRGDARAIAVTTHNVVLADWLFIATSGVVQPVTGAALVLMAGYDPRAPWLVATYLLYVLAGACWLGAVWMQLRVAAIAARCAADGSKLPGDYYRAMRIWFWLGWPGFLSLVAVFALMVFKPQLW
jgi:uncharacterized membrane protein